MRRYLVPVLLAATLVPAPAHAAPRYDLLSASPPGWARHTFVSATGRYVTWTANPGKNDMTEGWGQQVMVHDRVKKVTEVVSVTPAGKPAANGRSVNAAEVSADGRYVVFDSAAPDLVHGDTNKVTDVFVRDRKLRKTTRLSVGRGGKQAAESSSSPRISPDGRTVIFYSCANLTDAPKSPPAACRRLFAWRNGGLRLVSDTAESTYGMASLSGDGRFAAFVHLSGCRRDVFVHEIDRGQTVPMTSDLVTGERTETCGVQRDQFRYPVLDAKGTAVWFFRHDDFTDSARSLVVRRDVKTGALTTVADLVGTTWTQGFSVSADGRRVVYVTGTDGTPNGATPSGYAVYAVEAGGKPVRISPAPREPVIDCPDATIPKDVDAKGKCVEVSLEPSMSADGKVVAFVTNVAISDADRTVTDDIYVMS